MKFRNYCIVVMGDTLGVSIEIEKISEIKPNILDAKGILIATFSSLAEPNELTDWFSENNRSFLVFDLDKKSSGFNFVKKNIENGLFGFLNNVNTDEMNENFLKAIELSSNTKSTKNVITKKHKKIKNNGLDIELIKKMSPSERQILLDELIDNGLENLSEEDKKILPLLAK